MINVHYFIHFQDEFSDSSEKADRKRKRKSRWGEKVMAIPPPTIAGIPPGLPPTVIPGMTQPSKFFHLRFCSFVLV